MTDSFNFGQYAIYLKQWYRESEELNTLNLVGDPEEE